MVRGYHTGCGLCRSKHQYGDGNAEPRKAICLSDTQFSKVPSPYNPESNLKSSRGKDLSSALVHVDGVVSMLTLSEKQS